jgi:hypothetical protein
MHCDSASSRPLDEDDLNAFAHALGDAFGVPIR